jgi:hypothetical protein
MPADAETDDKGQPATKMLRVEASFVDAEAKDSRKKGGQKRKKGQKDDSKKKKKGDKDGSDSSKEKKTKKIGVREAKAMAYGKKQISNLLQLLQPYDRSISNNPTTHYEFKGEAVIKGIAEALKWAYTVDRLEAIDNPDLVGSEVFWDWWSAPMFSVENKTWQEKWEDKDLTDKKVWDEVQECIARKKEEWHETYMMAIPKQDAIDKLQYYVSTKLKEDDVLLNPGFSDRAMADQANQFLSSTFILIEQDGTSITWEEKDKLWIKRNQSRSGVAIARGLAALHKEKILFTDEEMEEKWKKRVDSAGSIMNVLHWMRSQETKWPNPIKQELDRDMWTLPLKEGKLVDFTTLKIRDRCKTDYFTSTTDIIWLEDYTKADDDIKYSIMQSDTLKDFKEAVKSGQEETIWDRLELLCPNAYRFCQGPFRNTERFRAVMLQLSLSMTTFCTRKALWIYGDGKGMKSTVLEALVAAMGQKACIVHKKVFFKTEDGSSGHNTDLMRAEGKRLILIDELARSDQLKETVYKQTVAHGTMSAREIYAGQSEWKAMCMVVLLSNVVVPLNFNNNAISDRTMAVKGTTRVFNPTDKTSSRPKHWKDADSWEDGLDEHGVYWVMKSQVNEMWAKKFSVQEDKGGYQNELGCFFILLAHYAYTLIKDPKNCGELPTKAIVTEDFNDFIREADHIHQWLKESCIIEKCPEEKKHRTPFDLVVSDYKGWCKGQGIKEVENKYLKQTLKAKGMITLERPVRWDKKQQSWRAYGSKKIFVLLQLRASSQSFEEDETVLEEKEEQKQKETEKERKEKEKEKITEEIEKIDKILEETGYDASLFY